MKVILDTSRLKYKVLPPPSSPKFRKDNLHLMVLIYKERK